MYKSVATSERNFVKLLRNGFLHVVNNVLIYLSLLVLIKILTFTNKS